MPYYVSTGSEIEASTILKEYIISDGNDIQLDTTVANVTGGVLEFTCFWQPISTDGNIVSG